MTSAGDVLPVPRVMSLDKPIQDQVTTYQVVRWFVTTVVSQSYLNGVTGDATEHVNTTFATTV